MAAARATRGKGGGKGKGKGDGKKLFLSRSASYVREMH